MYRICGPARKCGNNAKSNAATDYKQAWFALTLPSSLQDQPNLSLF